MCSAVGRLRNVGVGACLALHTSSHGRQGPTWAAEQDVSVARHPSRAASVPPGLASRLRHRASPRVKELPESSGDASLAGTGEIGTWGCRDSTEVPPFGGVLLYRDTRQAPKGTVRLQALNET